MKFNTWTTNFDAGRKIFGAKCEKEWYRFYDRIIQDFVSKPLLISDRFARYAVHAEVEWYNCLKPVYKIDPNMAVKLSRSRINFGCEHLKFPYQSFLISQCDETPFTTIKRDNQQQSNLRSTLVHQFESKDGTPGLLLLSDYGECAEDGLPIREALLIVISSGETVEERLQDSLKKAERN